MIRRTIATLIAVLAPLGAATAADIAVTAKKLVIVDKLAAKNKAQVLFLAKDKAAGITKGTGSDTGDVSARFAIMHTSGSPAGAFVLPAGAFAGSAGWKSNSEKLAKYVNKSAPAGPTEVKLSLVKPGKLLKVVAKGAGDTRIDIVSGGDPGGSFFTSYCVTTGGDVSCHCSEFSGCSYKRIVKDTGAKLVCKRGIGDPTCQAGSSATSTTTTSTSTTTTLPCLWSVVGDFETGTDINTITASGNVLWAWLSGPNSLTLTVSGSCPGELCVYRVGDASDSAILEAEQRSQNDDVSGLTPLSCGPASSPQVLGTDSSYVFVVTAQ